MVMILEIKNSCRILNLHGSDLYQARVDGCVNETKKAAIQIPTPSQVCDKSCMFHVGINRLVNTPQSSTPQIRCGRHADHSNCMSMVWLLHILPLR